MGLPTPIRMSFSELASGHQWGYLLLGEVIVDLHDEMVSGKHGLVHRCFVECGGLTGLELGLASPHEGVLGLPRVL